MRIDVLSIFPEVFEPLMSTSIIGRARERGIIELNCHDLRDWSKHVHRKVDDYPYGGGGGMVMKAEPFFRFYDDLSEELERKNYSRQYVVMLSARGRPWKQSVAFDFSKLEQLTLFCGHYKGIDARVEEIVDEELSLGDFVLSGGEIPAMALIDSLCRLLPGAVGDRASIAGDSFYDGILGPPEYTRPECFRGLRVPEVLLGGNHALIEEWRRNKALDLTRERRPELLSPSASTEDGAARGEVEFENHEFNSAR